MDNIFRLIFILFFFSTPVFSAWSPNPSQRMTSFGVSELDKLLGMPMRRDVSSDDFKRLMGMPSKANYSSPVPSSASATGKRIVPIPKSFLGGASRFLLKASSWQFQAALLAAEFILDEYTEEEIADNPALEGEFKDISKLEDVYSEGVITDWKVRYYSGSLLEGNALKSKIAACDAYYYWIPHEGCAVYPGESTPTFTSIWAYGHKTQPKITSEEVPVTDDDLYDALIKPMSDSDFEDFINDPKVRPFLENSSPASDVRSDFDDDFSRASDSLPNGDPDLSTQPITKDSNDTDLDTLSVPEYEGLPILDSDTVLEGDYLVSTSTSVETEVSDLTTIVTTTVVSTYIDPNTRRVIRVDTDVTVDTVVQPDPQTDPEVDIQPDPITTTTTTTSTSDGNGLPTPVEVVNFPDAMVNPPPAQEEHNICEEHPDALACLNVGTDFPDPPEVPEYRVPFQVNIYSLSSNAVCPLPVSFSLLTDGKTYSISYNPICDFAVMMKPLIIALGLFLAFTIVGDSLKQGGVT